MKYSVKNICVEFGGWALEFSRVRSFDFIEFRDSFVNISEEKYNESGGLKIDELNREEIKRLRNVTPEFLAQHLVSAKNEDEVAETEREKLILIDFLSDEPEFRTFSEGYINGEKKT